LNALVLINTVKDGKTNVDTFTANDGPAIEDDEEDDVFSKYEAALGDSEFYEDDIIEDDDEDFDAEEDIEDSTERGYEVFEEMRRLNSEVK
jgi:hypothetical protein